MAEHNDFGKWGEEVAADYLMKQGYCILERDWKSGHRDIDLIARQNDTIVFIEVKTRRNRLFAEPEQAVDWRKRKNLRAAINHYVKYRRIDLPIRFDIITVIGYQGTAPEINHLQDIWLY